MEVELIIIIISILLSAFFSGMEIAFVSANKMHIELEKKRAGLVPKILSIITQKSSKFIKNHQKSSKINENQWKLMIFFFNFWNFLVVKLEMIWKSYLDLPLPHDDDCFTHYLMSLLGVLKQRSTSFPGVTEA